MNRAMVLMVALVLGMPVSASEVEELEAAPEQVPAPESQSTVTKKVYKSYDKDGSVKFTDEPVDGSQEIEVRESNRVQFVRPEVKPSPEDELEQVLDIKPVSYKVNIAAPGDQSHYHNHAEPIPVRVSVQPELQQGDRIEVTDNGEVISPGEGGGYQLEYPPRGEHRLEARIINSKGNVVAEAEAVTIYIHRASILNRPQAKPTPKPSP